MNSVDQIIEAYKRGVKDGRKEGVSQGVPYGDWQRQQEDYSSGNPPVDTRRIICRVS